MRPQAQIDILPWLTLQWSGLRAKPLSTKLYYGAGAAGALGLCTGALGLAAALRSARLSRESDFEGSHTARGRALALGVATDALLAAALGAGGAGYLIKRRQKANVALSPTPHGVALIGRF